MEPPTPEARAVSVLFASLLDGGLPVLLATSPPPSPFLFSVLSMSPSWEAAEPIQEGTVPLQCGLFIQ